MIHIKNSYAIFIWQGEYHGGFMTSATISSLVAILGSVKHFCAQREDNYSHCAAYWKDLGW